MATSVDVAIVGAGPAGMAAAALASDLGLATLVLDEQPEPGGQIYRAVESVALHRPALLDRLGRDYGAGRSLVEALRAANVEYLPDAVVWNVDRDLVLAFSHAGASRQVGARHLLVASGALERPVPIPGWTLPGVMTAGALQILLKSSGLAPSGRTVLAGCGPLLLALAEQYLRVGVLPGAIVETVSRRDVMVALPRLAGAFGAGGYVAKGLRMMRAIRAVGVPWYRGARRLRAEGAEAVEALSFEAGGGSHRLETDVVALHQGVVPNPQLTRLVGCAHDWDERQRCFRPRLDDWFMTDVEGVSVAGDGAGIGGAEAAASQGRLAVLGIARRLGRIDSKERDRRAVADRHRLVRDLAVRPFLDAAYPPAPEILRPDDDVMVCRCEEVTAGAVRAAVRLGCPGPNQAKSLLRCGMGPCQGRLCGLTVSEIIAHECGIGLDETGYYRIRPPLKPLPLGELAALAPADGEA